MNGKTVKLLRKYANKTGFNYKEMKAEYKKLNKNERHFRRAQMNEKTHHNLNRFLNSLSLALHSFESIC